MRGWIALVLACAGCPGGGTDECKLDSECGGTAVCARNGECLPASEVRAVRITWTIRGMPASDSTCAPSPDFYLSFQGTTPDDTFGYAPVPCDAGLFVVDKLPRRYVSVEIGVVNGFNAVRAFDANGNAAFELFP
jgi:hypothetical protein